MFRNALFAAKVTGGLLAGVAALPAAASAPLSVTVPSAMPLAAVGISDVACSPVAPAPIQPLAAPTSASSSDCVWHSSSMRLKGSSQILEVSSTRALLA